jgi:methyl-accepting chemotaxis protein
MKNKNFSAYRDAVLSSIVVLIISIVTGFVVYNSAAKGLKQEVQNYLASLSATASNMVDVEKHQQITKPEDKGNEIYEAVRAPFLKILHANPNIAFIYTAIRKEDGKIFFIIDSKIVKEGEEDDTSAVMEEYPDFTETMVHAFETQKVAVEEEAYTDEYGTFLSGYAPIFDANKNFIGIVGVDIRITDYLERLSKVRKSLIIGTIIAGFASLLVGFGVFVARKSAIHAEQKNIEQQNQLIQFEKARIEEQKISEESAKKQIAQQRNSLAENFNKTVKGAVNVISSSSIELDKNAKEISELAKTSAEKTAAVAKIISNSSNSMGQVSNSAGILLDGIDKISDEVNNSVTIASAAQKESLVVKEKSSQLNIAAENISNIADLIDTISEQINLLALNATIEAARAGEAGKGFAVVASEVKSLAGQANAATAQINTYLEAIKNVATETTDAIDKMSNVINDLNSSSQRVISVTTGQKNVVAQITRELNNASDISKNSSAEVKSVSEFANKSGQSTEEILHSITKLSSEADKLNIEVNNFLNELLKDNG